MTIATAWVGRAWTGAAWAGESHSALSFIHPYTAAFLARITSPPTSARASLIDALVKGLVANSTWALYDGIWLLASADEQTTTLNLKGTSYPLTNSGMTFTADRGLAGNGSSTYADTAFNPSTAGGAFSLNSAHQAIWTETDGGTTVGNGLSTTSYLGNNGTSVFHRLNDGTTTSPGGGAATGLFTSVRRDSANKHLYVNGTLINSAAVASNSVANGNYRIGRWGTSASYNSDRLALLTLGGALSDAQVAANYTLFRAYMTGVGVA